jgi:threonine synthase
LKSSKISATRRISTSCLLETPATSLPTGRATANSTPLDARPAYQKWSDSKPLAQPRFSSINPHRIEGQKTASFEIIEDLGDAPDIHILPVGNAGNITAYWKGYREFHAAGRSTRLPKMVGFQAAGSAPIFFNQPIEKPDTVATAIRIGNPASWQAANNAVSESGGCIDIVTDEEILAAQAWLAANEGIFVEPASAASVAGLLKCHSNARCSACPFPSALRPGAKVVLTVTGHGLKDTETPVKFGGFTPAEADANLAAVRAVLDQS